MSPDQKKRKKEKKKGVRKSPRITEAKKKSEVDSANTSGTQALDTSELLTREGKKGEKEGVYKDEPRPTAA